MRKVKIAICGLVQMSNLGEHFIADTLEYLIKDELSHKYKDITPEISQVSIYTLSFPNINIFTNIYYKLWKICGNPENTDKTFLLNICFWIRHICWCLSSNCRPKYKKLFEHQLRDKDIIIISGAGLLEYSYNEYQEALFLISKIGEKYNIPIVYNAVGTAGSFDTKDYRCRRMMKAMNSKQIKFVSSRDSNEIVQKYFDRNVNNINVTNRFDAAICLSDAYKLTPKSEENLVGIGLIRGNALQSYQVYFTEEDWIKLFIGIASELTSRGYKFKFFTNGYTGDYELGQKVILRMNLDSSYLVERPVDAKVLAETISTFKGMITCRMHSVIAGMSIGVPSVALSWNKKLNKYMKLIGHPERVIDVDDFNPKFIVDRYEVALKEGYTKELINASKESAKMSVRGYIDLIASLGREMKYSKE